LIFGVGGGGGHFLNARVQKKKRCRATKLARRGEGDNYELSHSTKKGKGVSLSCGGEKLNFVQNPTFRKSAKRKEGNYSGASVKKKRKLRKVVRLPFPGPKSSENKGPPSHVLWVGRWR